MKEIPVRKIPAQEDEFVVTGKFKIRTIAAILGVNDLVQDLHRHDFFFILVLQNGTGTHQIDFVDYKIQPHSVFVLRPGQVHQLTLHAGSTGFLLEFDLAFYHPTEKRANQRLIKAGHKNFLVFEGEKFTKILELSAHIFNEFTSKQEGYLEVIKASLDIFFIELIRQTGNPTTAEVTVTNTYAQERYEEFLELLATHITRQKQVAQYAGLMSLTPYQLNSISRAIVGKPASEVINEHIILEARRYLLATTNQVKDIADQLGYEDISYFIRFFKKHTGHTPEAFRKHFQ